MIEQWKDIPGFETYYEASNYGQIRRIGRVAGAVVGRIIKESTNKAGYKRVGLWREGRLYNTYSHRAIASAFYGKSELPVNHINGIKTDNRVQNLEFVTHKQNAIHAIDVLGHKRCGQFSSAAKLSVDDVLAIRQRFSSGESAYAIAKTVPVTHSTVHRIVTRRIWNNV